MGEILEKLNDKLIQKISRAAKFETLFRGICKYPRWGFPRKEGTFSKQDPILF